MFVRQKKTNKQNTVSVFCTVFNALPPQSSVDDVKIWARVFALFNKTRLLIKVLFALINGRIKHKLFSDPVWLSLYTPYHFTSFHGNKGFVDLSSLLWQVPFLTLLLRPYGSHQLGPRLHQPCHTWVPQIKERCRVYNHTAAARAKLPSLFQFFCFNMCFQGWPLILHSYAIQSLWKALEWQLWKLWAVLLCLGRSCPPLWFAQSLVFHSHPPCMFVFVFVAAESHILKVRAREGQNHPARPTPAGIIVAEVFSTCKTIVLHTSVLRRAESLELSS